MPEGRYISASLLIIGLMLNPMFVWSADLLEIFQLALQSDPEIRRAHASYQGAAEVKPQSRARFLPSLYLAADRSGNRQEATYSSSRNDAQPGNILHYTTEGYSLSLTQPLFHYDAYIQWQQADVQVTRAEAWLAAAQQDLMLRVAESYFGVLSAQDNLTFARGENQAIERQLEQTKQRFNVGLIAITDVHEAQARFDLSVTQEIDADNRLANAHEALREITGQYHQQLALLNTAARMVAPNPADIDRWAEVALQQNLQLIATRLAADIARQEVKRRRSQRYPVLDLVGKHSFIDNSDSNSFTAGESQNSSISVRLNWSLYNGGLMSSNTRKAQHSYTEARESLEKQRRSIVRQVRGAFLGVLASINRAKALKQALVSHRSAMDATEAGFEVGTRTTVDVLNTRTGLYLAQRDHAQSRYDYILNTLRLKQAAGILSIEDLQQVNVSLE